MEQIQEILSNPMTGNIAQIGTILLLLAKELVISWVTRKLIRKDIEIGAVMDRLQLLESNLGGNTSTTNAILESNKMVGQLVHTLIQGAKLNADVKDHATDIYSKLSTIVVVTAADEAEGLIEKGKEMLAEVVGEPVAEMIEEVVEDLIEDVPEHLRNLTSK